MERKFTLMDIWQNQHPVVSSWILISSVGIVVMYAYILSLPLL